VYEDTQSQRHLGKDTRTYVGGGDLDDREIVPTPDIGWVAPSSVDATCERIGWIAPSSADATCERIGWIAPSPVDATRERLPRR